MLPNAVFECVYSLQPATSTRTCQFYHLYCAITSSNSLHRDVILQLGVSLSVRELINPSSSKIIITNCAYEHVRLKIYIQKLLAFSFTASEVIILGLKLFVLIYCSMVFLFFILHLEVSLFTFV